MTIAKIDTALVGAWDADLTLTEGPLQPRGTPSW
jgi:hypothetical protein